MCSSTTSHTPSKDPSLDGLASFNNPVSADSVPSVNEKAKEEDLPLFTDLFSLVEGIETLPPDTRPPTPMGHIQVDPADVDVVIYHGACYDGLGAAWAAWRLLGDEGIVYKPMQHQHRPPPVSGKTVALLDISLPTRVMQHIELHSKGMVVLDHHISAVDDIKVIPEKNKVFDMEQSGATLAWQFFHPDKPIPDILRYVEDRDLWNFSLPHSEEFNTALMTNPLSMKVYETIHRAGDEGVKTMIQSGASMLKFAHRSFRSIVNKAVYRTWKNGGYKVALVNSPAYKSEVGNILAECEADVDFAMIWHYEHAKKECWVSIRASQASTLDLSAIAKSLGGGVSFLSFLSLFVSLSLSLSLSLLSLFSLSLFYLSLSLSVCIVCLLYVYHSIYSSLTLFISFPITSQGHEKASAFTVKGQTVDHLFVEGEDISRVSISKDASFHVTPRIREGIQTSA